MTTTSTTLVSLDFETNKAALKAYLQAQPLFRDFDFEASNIALLIDLLAYNNFQNAFYTNMALSEGFLDSAQKRSSIISHAKDLNYLPTSVRSAKASVEVTFEASGLSQPYTIEKGMPFTVLVKSKAFVFTTPKAIVCSSANTTFTFETDIYEGTYLSDVYMFSASEEIQRFEITNQTVDTSSIAVTVFEDGSQFGDTYMAVDSLLGLGPTSKVFFVQATHDGYYEILFGDNIFGRRPKTNALINIEYRISQGAAANGGKTFTIGFDPTGASEMTNNATVETVAAAGEGAPRQSNESIRAYAPRYFATQQRAVASDDYASLILAKFSGQVDDVNVYGGETQEPKLYGRVVVAIKPSSGVIAPDFLKQEILAIMRPYVSIPTRMIATDPEYFYCKIVSDVQYDKTATTKKTSELRGLIQTAMNTFSEDNLERFGKDFRYSRFINTIDEVDPSIVSNDTEVTLTKRITPLIQFPTSYEIYFGNALRSSATSSLPTLTSDTFTYLTDLGVYYENAYLKDDDGVIKVYTTVNDIEVTINSDIGSVNYETGYVAINKILVSDYDTFIGVTVVPEGKDIIMQKQNILFIDLDDVSIEIVEQST